MARRKLSRAQIRAGFGGKAAQRSARGTKKRRGAKRNGHRMAKFGRARAYGRGIFGKLASKRTLSVAAVGAATDFVPPVFQPAATAIGGAFVGSETLVDIGAFSAGKQLVRMMNVPGAQIGNGGGYL